MNAVTVSTVVLAVIGVLGVMATLFGWMYKRGANDHVLTDNTNATRELTGELRNFKTSTIEALHDHDIRLTRLESK